jgi:hypothetical protein
MVVVLSKTLKGAAFCPGDCQIGVLQLQSNAACGMAALTGLHGWNSRIRHDSMAEFGKRRFPDATRRNYSPAA